MHKNDQYRDGHVSVFDYWSRKPTCPVGITERISSLLPDSGGPAILLFAELLILGILRSDFISLLYKLFHNLC